MHEIGDHVPQRERFVIPRESIPNKHRKQLREQFMRRTHLVLKESTPRHLAQNREATRKSRLRKKTYVQQLESSILKLTHLEQDRARSEVLFSLITHSIE